MLPFPAMSNLDQSYDWYPRIEQAFLARLDESLHPRGGEFLYEVIGALGLRPGAKALDLGCGMGGAAIQLAVRFGLEVTGVDPVLLNIELAAAAIPSGLRDHLRFEQGKAEAIPAEDASIDLIWCKEVLVLVRALDEAFAECRRVLKDDGRMLIYQVSPTERMEPREGTQFTTEHSGHPAIEAAFSRAGFVAEETIDLTSEGGEWSEETSGVGTRRLLHASRMLRQPDRYIAEFGQEAYDIMLNDCLWHVYRMIGKLTARVYVLRVG
jgi:SAM-dependent methyltransferase